MSERDVFTDATDAPLVYDTVARAREADETPDPADVNVFSVSPSRWREENPLDA